MPSPVKLTQYSHGAGCGCKIAPDNLAHLLKSNLPKLPTGRLVVGNDDNDDAAVFDLGDGRGIISTTDFFMPIVDDPFHFGQIAAANALSDVYAMGGQPLMAIAIFGWPVDALPLDVGQQVIEGGRETCHRAGVHLAGGHSIDAPEPIFGLAATGIVPLQHLKQNTNAQVGDQLFLSKGLGVGVLTTAEKKGLLSTQHQDLAIQSMLKLNRVGADLATLPGVTAMTDVTGFGLLGHLLELCRGSHVAAQLDMTAVPLLDPCVIDYRDHGAIPGGYTRNWRSYGKEVGNATLGEQQLLCDPQTSGGLLIAVRPNAQTAVSKMLAGAGDYHHPIGRVITHKHGQARVEITH